MSVQRPTTHTDELPTELESPRAKLVYLFLQTREASIDELQTGLGVKKITLYSILRTLRERELVEKRDGRFAVAE
ncbi:TrmB family transcriptional regulator [Halorussus gelatinilyticus]|uniref:TrmB family transcriptional regulator n=1 Tax=Halorussus gelatinilyticus TaxID=2937524 RepID=A0A8U0IHH8_9EURY|nr:TrmB family transcriptional regulator [Halorussus gelatinilyticus]UPW00443.1 TrmB family transcriptional regulator [Halorussus gelatinilyticus]